VGAQPALAARCRVRARRVGRAPPRPLTRSGATASVRAGWSCERRRGGMAVSIGYPCIGRAGMAPRSHPFSIPRRARAQSVPNDVPRKEPRPWPVPRPPTP
jgi:hypothetical protein